jgi:hypothetical protein
MFEETNEKLRSYLLKFIPILEKHHEYAKKKWLNREMLKAAYEQIHQRYIVSTMLNNRLDIKDEQLVHICSEITIDIHQAVELLDKEEKDKYNILVDEWYNCFKKIGYIDIHPVFRKPEKNLMAFEEFEKKHKK